MQDPDQWRSLGVHWHAHVETGDGVTMPLREMRMAADPHEVFFTPEDTAEWIATMTREHVHPTTVRLIGPNGGEGQLGDEGHVDHDLAVNLDVLCRGDGLQLAYPREHDHLHLLIDAVTTDECLQGHDVRR
ncbi:hypothetical protein [Saccharopolyspora rosea]|uniref:Uncharacterized protein n=1 Tax=Saccharopolyspora rosea TaxID=524884 RepID=A0ABW3G0I3_9PSEU|nr:hypothetical protein [Saccharopolyspora rosea]